MNWLILFGVVLLWASAFIGIKVGLDSFSPGALALFRYLIASLFILIFYLRQKTKKMPTFKEFLLLFLCGVTGLAIYNVALNYAEIHVSPAISSFVISMMPVCALLIGVLAFGDKVYRFSQICIAICILGVVIIFASDLHYGKDSHASILGFVALLLAIIGAAIYSNVQRVLIKKGFKPLEMTAWSIWLGTLSMLFFLPETITQVAHADWQDVGVVIYLGIFPAAIAYVGYGYAISRLPFTKVMTALYFSPLLVTLLQWMILGDLPYGLTFFGGLVSVVGALMLVRQKRQ